MGERRHETGAQESADALAEEGSWQPNQHYLRMLMEMGFSKTLARTALFQTGNASADLAAAWVLEGGADLEENEVNQAPTESDYDVYKMVFVINCELQMGIGKIAAQVAHATIGMHRLLLQDEGKYGEMLLEWQTFGETKIVLRGDTTHHLVDLEKQALAIGLPTYMVQDAGKTQVPEGSTTVLCMMGRIDLVDQVTGKLRLL